MVIQKFNDLNISLLLPKAIENTKNMIPNQTRAVSDTPPQDAQDSEINQLNLRSLGRKRRILDCCGILKK